MEMLGGCVMGAAGGRQVLWWASAGGRCDVDRAVGLLLEPYKVKALPKPGGCCSKWGEASLLLTSSRLWVHNPPKTAGKAMEGHPEQCVRWGPCVRVAAAHWDGTLGSPCGTRGHL